MVFLYVLIFCLESTDASVHTEVDSGGGGGRRVTVVARGAKRGGRGVRGLPVRIVGGGDRFIQTDGGSDDLSLSEEALANAAPTKVLSGMWFFFWDLDSMF